MEKKECYFKKNLTLLLSVLVGAVASGLYIYWLATADELTPMGAVVSGVCLFLFAFAIILCIPKCIRFFSGEDDACAAEAIGERSAKRDRLHPLIKIFLLALLGRLALILAAYVINLTVNGYQGTLFETLRSIWTKTYTSDGISNIDAQHYFSIAEQWYPTQDPECLTLVFFPLFPLLIRLFNLVFHDSFTSAFIINTICSCVSAALIYELALCDMNKRSARFASFCAFAFPAAIFYCVPMSEALFLMLSAATLLSARKQKFWIAAIFGALAAFTRSLGALLILPVATEAIAACVRKHCSNEKTGEKALIVTACIAPVCILLGTFGYLLINKMIWGDWFKFLTFQRDNWQQSFNLFFDTPSYQLNNLVRAINDKGISQTLGLWLPNLLSIFSALIVFVLTAKKMRTSYSIYFAAYYAACIGTTWLLSASRYLTAMVVLPLATAYMCDSGDDDERLSISNKKRTVVGIGLLLLQVLYLMMFIRKFDIY